MPKDNIITRTLAQQAQTKRDVDAWVEGRFIYYAPSFFPSEVVKEWGGRWDKRKQAWRLPRLIRNAKKIRNIDPDISLSTDVRNLIEMDVEAHDEMVFMANLKDEAERHPAWDELKDFQKKGAMAMVIRALHGEMLLLSPGLGKTPVSIVAADLLQHWMGDTGRICIVAPLSLTPNWMREITGTQIVNEKMGQKQIQWSEDPSYEICHGEPPTPTKEIRWTITNPETCMERAFIPPNRWVATGNLDPEWDLDWDLVILDESVLYKNRKSKRTTSIRTLTRAAKRVIECTGSPITHDNSDAWAQFNMMEPDWFTSFWTYTQEACVVQESTWSKYEIQGSRPGFHLRQEYQDLLFVRNQEEVFDELPENLVEDIELPLSKRQAKAHQEILDDWLHILEENPDRRVEVTVVIAMLTRLQQVTSNLYNLQTTGEEWPDDSTKADFVLEDLTRGDVEWPCLVWTWHRPGAHALVERLRKRAADKKNGDALYGKRIELVVGGMKKKADEYISAYKAGEVDVLVLGIGVGKYGHTLANSRTIYIYDKTWDSDAWFQMLHRFGGARAVLSGYTHRPVLKVLRCRGTVDDFVEMNLAGKLPAMADMTGADLSKILRSLGEDRVA